MPRQGLPQRTCWRSGRLATKLDPATVIEVSDPDLTAAQVEILRRLRSLGAKDECWVIACNTLDRGSNELGWVIPDVVGFSAITVISCIRGELAFVEDTRDRHLILARPGGTTTALA